VCLQETKAEQSQSEVVLPDYVEYWNSSKNKKGYSGTAIFSKTEPDEVLYDFPAHIVEKYALADEYGDLTQEGRVIAARFPESNDGVPGFWLVTVYTPNSKPDLSRLEMRHKHWDPAFLAYCQELQKDAPVVFCGDLNAAHTEGDLANPKANVGEHGFTDEEREGISAIIKAGFVDTFRHFVPKGNGHYTWWTHWANSRARNVGWRIDYFFISKKLLPRLHRAEILPATMGSDHCPVLIELK
jgi:exodeoxyribonuclease-3